ncbi:MAG: hypothetical protein Q8M73_12340 [Actinomycetota bacterium]|nr:hypothetical protein [Actinomycetota bacterium]
MLRKLPTVVYAAALVTGSVWLTACSASPDAAPQTEKPTVLFSLSADTMRLENPSGDDVTLVMEGVDPHAIWFTDRPARKSGAITTGRLAAEWEDGDSFNEDPPNAALVLHQPVKVGDGATDTLVVEILGAAYDPKEATFRADLKVLTKERAASLKGNLATHGGRHDLAWPASAGAVSLFIDSITLCTNTSTCNESSPASYTVDQAIYFHTNLSN